MKPIKIILSLFAITFIVSCSITTNYKMVTTLDRNGNVHREIYALDTKTGEDTSKNPFLFEFDSSWQIHRFDTVIKYNFIGEKREFNVKISKNTNSIEQYSQKIQCNKHNQSFAAPEESLVKKFKWFYTYYSFKAVYKNLKYEVPIPISDYLNEEEQLIWTQGYMNNFKVMNGYEMKDYLDEINKKFWKWQGHNYFEISFESIKKLTTGYDLEIDKENIYAKIYEAEVGAFDISPETVCSFIDSFYKTTYFSQLYKTNEEVLKNNFETSTSTPMDCMGNAISYELVIPDKLIKTNAPIIASDTLIWKIDGMRLLFNDYSLSAEYRVTNKWAFILFDLVVIAAIGSVFVLYREKLKNLIICKIKTTI